MRQRSPVDRGQFDFALGAVLLARRKSAGRWVTAGAALAVLVFQLVEYGARSGILPTSGASPLSTLSTLSSVILPITLISVVLTGSTAAGWTKAGRAANPQSTLRTKRSHLVVDDCKPPALEVRQAGPHGFKLFG